MDAIKPAKGYTLQYLQVLRGIASLLVVLMHAGFTFKFVSGNTFLGDVFAFGGAGVDIFFVLSGFIITYSCFHLTSDARNLPGYLRRRFVRIYPPYWVLFFVFLALHWVFWSHYANHDIFRLDKMLGSLLLLPGHEMVNGVSWTLTCELFFYVLFAGFFLVKRKIIFAAVLALYGLLLVLIGETDRGPWMTILLFPMNIEFLLGIAVAFLWKKLNVRLAKILLVAGIAGFIAGGWLAVRDIMIFHGSLNRVVIFGLPSSLIIISLIRLEREGGLVRPSRLLLALGDASYSLYLIHLPLLAAGMRILVSAGVTDATLLHVLTILLIIAICVAGLLFYRWIERPLIGWLNKKRQPGLTVAKEP